MLKSLLRPIEDARQFRDQTGVFHTMRRLYLLRHAKAEPASTERSDAARTLARRGREDANLVGRTLQEHGLLPDCALVSPAVRTRETWDLVSAQWRTAPVMRTEARIYDAPAARLLTLIQTADDTVRALMIIGHNPGLHDLVLRLAPHGRPDARAAVADNLPTCGLAVIDFTATAWSDVASGAGTLAGFLSPTLLRENPTKGLAIDAFRDAF